MTTKNPQEAREGGDLQARINAELGKVFKDDPANACRAHAAITAALASQQAGAAVPSDREPWYCPHCQNGVPAKNVTHEETHDPRAGGCGNKVGDWPVAGVAGATIESAALDALLLEWHEAGAALGGSFYKRLIAHIDAQLQLARQRKGEWEVLNDDGSVYATVFNEAEAHSYQDAGFKVRAATPPSAQQEPSKQPELTVWYGPMPESNGKSKFTAVLMRKDDKMLDGFTDGITIDRSEYPDRVRYEADRVRYLIGELAERPDIIAYDADKHSGYKKPSAQQEQGDAVRDSERLDFITTFGEPWSVQWEKRGTKPVRYRMIHDGEPWGQWHNSARAAIDAAMRATKTEGEEQQ